MLHHNLKLHEILKILLYTSDFLNILRVYLITMIIIFVFQIEMRKMIQNIDCTLTITRSI